MTPIAAGFDVAPGIRLAADIFGDADAPTVLMLHGGGQTRHAWQATATDLADAGRRAVTVDLRGHGESSHPRPPAYALEDFAADVRGLIASAPAEPIVIGASLGGIASLLAITESPRAAAAGLILVDVAHRFRPRGGGRIVSFMEEHPDGFASLADAAEAVAAYLPRRARLRDPNGLRHNLRRNVAGRWVWHWDPEFLRQARPLIQDQAQLSERLTTAATRLRLPCLLVRGADSDVLSAGIAREFIGLAPNATLAEVPDAGHMVAGDNNDAFTVAISTWLRELAPGVAISSGSTPVRKETGRGSDSPHDTVTLGRLAEMKARGEAITMVTAFDFNSARVADAAGIDIVLVGDTAAPEVLGYIGTESVTIEEMIVLGKAVRRGLRRALMVGDLPMGTYEAGDEAAVRSAQRLVKETGCHVVKLEGGGESVARARAIVAAGIPVMGHVGLTPQSATALGGYKTQGKTGSGAARLLDDALALQAAGCFAVVFEAVPDAVTELIVARLAVPTIGIGAGPATAGQVLVLTDLLGLTTGRKPKFAKPYADLHGEMVRGVERFAGEVRTGTFPGPERGHGARPRSA